MYVGVSGSWINVKILELSNRGKWQSKAVRTWDIFTPSYVLLINVLTGKLFANFKPGSTHISDAECSGRSKNAQNYFETQTKVERNNYHLKDIKETCWIRCRWAFVYEKTLFEIGASFCSKWTKNNNMSRIFEPVWSCFG